MRSARLRSAGVLAPRFHELFEEQSCDSAIGVHEKDISVRFFVASPNCARISCVVPSFRTTTNRLPFIVASLQARIRAVGAAMRSGVLDQRERICPRFFPYV